MLTVLAEIGVRAIARRAERGEGDTGSEQPGDNAEQKSHGSRISMVCQRHASALARDICVVNVDLLYSACLTPRPSMKRSLICTGSRRVVPVPGLSSMRTPIRVGAEADID